MNWQVFTQLSTLQVQIHWVAAVVSLVLGVAIFLRRKGNAVHMLIGRIYVVAMVVTSVSAFFIRSLTDEQNPTLFSGFSWIHLLIPYTLVSLFLAIRAIKQGRVKAHRSAMLSTFIGGIIIAGAFTFLPGRHMHSLFFGNPAQIQQLVEIGAKR